MAESKREKIAIIGSGMIGHCWATLFLGGGYQVCMYDISQDRVDAALNAVQFKLNKLKDEGLLHGTLSVEERLANLSTTTDLQECLAGAIYAQESAVEDLQLKTDLFMKIDSLTGPDTILASSTSTLAPSKFTENLKHRENCLVVHPVNPPVYCPLTELIPAPWTKPAVVDITYSLMNAIGQSPIKLTREVDGFAINRLQYAILAEAWRMVHSGVISTADVNKVISEGLGLRWAFYGPLEVSHMNADGIKHHNERYGQGVIRVVNDFGPTPTFFEPETLEKIASDLNQKIPIEKLAAHRAWREHQLGAIAQLKRKLAKEKPADL
uniref:3-hydroxyacyl-CoA dehydrogenase n=1 Tax=Plectus sambesii TaxID=2011161 RepID=A0A914VR34_9BILA